MSTCYLLLSYVTTLPFINVFSSGSPLVPPQIIMISTITASGIIVVGDSGLLASGSDNRLGVMIHDDCAGRYY